MFVSGTWPCICLAQASLAAVCAEPNALQVAQSPEALKPRHTEFRVRGNNHWQLDSGCFAGVALDVASSFIWQLVPTMPPFPSPVCP